MEIEKVNQGLILSDGYWNYSLLQSYEDDIRDLFTDIKLSFIEIGHRLSIIEAAGAYRTASYYPECWGGDCSRVCNNIYEYAEVKFGYGRTTTKNFLALYKEFCSPSGGLLPEYKDFNYSQLVEMIPLAPDQREQITPEATIKDIRKVKKSLKQLDTEDVSEEESEDDSEEESIEIGQTSDQKEEAIPEIKELTEDEILANAEFSKGSYICFYDEDKKVCIRKVTGLFVNASHGITYAFDGPSVNFEAIRGANTIIDEKTLGASEYQDGHCGSFGYSTYILSRVKNPYKEKSVQYNIYQKAIDDVISFFKRVVENDYV